MSTITEITVPDDAWMDASDPETGAPKTRLLTTLVINGCYMHLEAIEVEDGTDWRVAVDRSLEELLDTIYAYEGPGGPLEELVIDGRSYILVATPHS